MSIFSYKVKDNKNKLKTGQIAAVNEDLAIKYLSRRGFSSISVKPLSKIEFKVINILTRIKGKDLVVFSRQFSIMMTANVSITEALITIFEQTENIKFKNIISQVAYDVDNGVLLSDALKKYPNVFSNFYCSVVKAGETSGKLDNVLEYLADEIEKDYDLMKKFRGALIYPAFIISGLFIVGIVFIFFVLPSLTKILEETGGELPLSTRIVIGASNFLQNYYVFLIVLLISIVIFIRFYLKTNSGKKVKDYITINFPIIGSIYRLVYIVRFSNSLSTLLKGGVSLIRSLEISTEIVNNYYYSNAINDSIVEVNEGGSVSSSLMENTYFPKMVPQIMMVGEKTGKMEESLDEIAKFYGKELNGKLNNLNTLLEPLIMVLMGIGVGIMVAAIILPMYNMASQF
jgi:type IV pilus assembly protein PilC